MPVQRSFLTGPHPRLQNADPLVLMQRCVMLTSGGYSVRFGEHAGTVAELSERRVISHSGARPSLYRVVRQTTSPVHSNHTLRRGVLGWLAPPLTFALGTAAGGLVAEQLALGDCGSWR